MNDPLNLLNDMMVLVCSNVCGVTPTLFHNILNDRMTYDEQQAAIRAIMNMDNDGPERLKEMFRSKLHEQEVLCLDYLSGKYQIVITNLDDNSYDFYSSISFSGTT